MEIIHPAATLSARTAGIGWYGYEEWSNKSISRQEPAGTRLVLILESGAPLTVATTQSTTRHVGEFLAGLDDAPTRTTHDGHQAGVQINLTLADAARWFGMPPAALMRQVVSALDILPEPLREVTRRLPDNQLSWSEKLQLIAAAMPQDALVLHRQAQTLHWVLNTIRKHNGGLPVESLARDVGWSTRRLQRAFSAYVGLSPKRYSRIVRFEALCSMLRLQEHLHWADATEMLGYFDQPHLSNEVQSLAGMTPDMLSGSIRAMTA